MKHKLLEIINVKQGDCLILRPDDCQYENEAFIIDTGNGIYNYTKNLAANEPYHVLLTHSHYDHINGFNLLLGNIHVNMKSLILPYYHNESVLIAHALLNLKGMAMLNEKWGLKWQLKQIIANQKVLINLGEKIEIQFVRDETELCNHIHVLNPPLTWKDHFYGLNDDIIQSLTELFEENFSEEVSLYLRMSINNSTIADSPQIYELMLNEYGRNDLQNRANYVLDFLLENLELMRSFNDHPTEKKLLKLIKQKELKDHQACVVIRCFYKKRWFIFGGDADKSVWNRLIREKKDISAYYLKVPHHGSKHNISESILKKINPTVAIISHDNGLFGMAKDPHPNKEVINCLNKNSIKLISTNDITKNKRTIWNCNKDNVIDSFVQVININ